MNSRVITYSTSDVSELSIARAQAGALRDCLDLHLCTVGDKLNEGANGVEKRRKMWRRTSEQISPCVQISDSCC